MNAPSTREEEPLEYPNVPADLPAKAPGDPLPRPRPGETFGSYFHRLTWAQSLRLLWEARAAGLLPRNYYTGRIRRAP